MKKGFWLLLVGCLFLTGCSEKAEEVETDPTQALITQVQQCSRLYTAEYEVHKIVTHDDVLRLRGQLAGEDYDVSLPMLGNRKIAIPMDATLKAYIDFDGFSEQNVKRNGDKIEITLPDPQVTLTNSKIDHANVKKYVALLRSDFSDAELASYEQQGRQAIVASAADMGIVETARQNAARVLIPMLKQMGFSEHNITITFRKDFTLNIRNERYAK